MQNQQDDTMRPQVTPQQAQGSALKLGVGVMVSHNGQVLLGKRLGSHGAGTWALPGGHVDEGETVEACAVRELWEETGLRALATSPAGWVSSTIEGQNYLTCFVRVEAFTGELELREPHKCAGWQWFAWDQLPAPLFAPLLALNKQALDVSDVEKAQSKAPTPASQTSGQAGDLDELLARVLAFHRERDWEQFHSPKNLVMDLAAEMGELVEPFRWLTEQQSYELDAKTHQEVSEEIADVFKVLVYLAHKLGIDPITASYQKLKSMAEKYPVDRCRGKALKYTAYKP